MYKRYKILYFSIKTKVKVEYIWVLPKKENK